MDWERLLTLISGAIAAIAGALYCEEWYRKKYPGGKMSTPSPSSTVTVSRWTTITKFLPVLTVACCLLYTIFGAIWIYKITHRADHKPLPEPIADYDEILKENKYDDEKLGEAELRAWRNGDYPYVILLFSQIATNRPNLDWEASRPLMIASELAQNPTERGYARFDTDLDRLLKDIQDDLRLGDKTGHAAWFKRSGWITEVKKNLNLLEERLPTTRKEKVLHVIRSIEIAEKQYGTKK